MSGRSFSKLKPKGGLGVLAGGFAASQHPQTPPCESHICLVIIIYTLEHRMVE
jgi:hypothetical protein